MTQPAHRRIIHFLHDQGLLEPDEPVAMVQLGGGVSSDLWKVQLPTGAVICVKGALAQLKVQSEWFAPVSRNNVEYEWLVFAEPLRPGQIPRALAHDESAGLFAMEYLPPQRYPVWKSLLLSGDVDTSAARAVGDLIGHLHAASAADSECRRTFATDENFDALRIDPYLRATGRVHPDLAGRLGDLASSTAGTHLAVVHGDLSPKNILLGPAGPVLLDAECAWFGDPAFDIAFCLNHLLLKSIKLPERASELRTAGLALLDAYTWHVDWESTGSIEARVAALLPALALARIDGRSPVEYLDRAQRDLVRESSRILLASPNNSVAQVWNAWTALTHDRAAAA